MVGGIVLVRVDPHHDGDVLALGWRGYDHLLRARIDVLACVGAGREPSGGFEHDVDAELAPRESGRIALGQNFHLVAVDDELPLAVLDVAIEASVDRIVLEEVGESLRVGEIVHRDEVEVSDARLLSSAEDLAADAAEAIDSDANCHLRFPVQGASPAARARP